MNCIITMINTNGENFTFPVSLSILDDIDIDNIINNIDEEDLHIASDFLNSSNNNDKNKLITYSNGDQIVSYKSTKTLFSDTKYLFQNKLEIDLLNYFNEKINLPILFVDSPITVKMKNGSLQKSIGTLLNKFIIVSTEGKSQEDIVRAVLHECLHYAYRNNLLFDKEKLKGLNLSEEEIVTNYAKYINFDSTNEDTDEEYYDVPFLGQYEGLFEAVNVDTSLRFTDFDKFKSSIWDTFDKAAPIVTNNIRDYNLFSEQIEITSPIQLFGLKAGDIIKIPSFNRIAKDKLNVYSVNYNDFDNDYFSMSRYYPISKIWKNSNGETLISFIANYGGKLYEKVLSFTDLKFICDTKNSKLEVRKFYGNFIGDKLDINSPRVDIVKKNFYDKLKTPDEAVLYLDDKGYYKIGNRGFKLPLSSEDNSNKKVLLTELLKPNDVVVIEYKTKNKKGEIEKHNFKAPVVRAYGNLVEILLQTKSGEFKLQKYNINNIIGLFLDKTNHETFINYLDEFSDYTKEQFRDLTKSNEFNRVWFNGTRSFGNLQTNLDTQAAIEFRRRAVKKLQAGDAVAITWNNGEKNIISKHMVAGVYGDNVYFYINPKKDNEVKIWRVDLKEIYPEKSKYLIKPALAGVYYNNYLNSDHVDYLNATREEINSQFIKNSIDGSWSLSEDTKIGEVKSLKDYYSIINIEDGNRLEEVSKLAFGDIVKYKTKNGTRIALVTKSNPLYNILQVTYSYEDKGEIKYVREDIDVNNILYVGFTNEYGEHPELNYTKNKLQHKLFDMNYSMLNIKTYDRANKFLYSCLENKSKNTSFTLVTSDKTSDKPKIVYVVPKLLYNTQEELGWNKDSENNFYYNGGTIRLLTDVQEQLNSGKYKDLTEEFCKRNNQEHLYSIIKQVTKNGITYTFKFPNTNNYRRYYGSYLLSGDSFKSRILPNDIIKLRYRNSNKDVKYTRYLRVAEVTDKGINLVGEIKNMETGDYTEYRWFVSWDKLGSNEEFDKNSDFKYTIEEFFYPYTGDKSTKIREKSLKEGTPIENNKAISKYVPTLDYYSEKIYLTQMISKLQELGLDRSKMRVYDNASIEEYTKDIKDLEVRNKIFNSGAFLYNGIIYINTDKAKVQSPIHELMHIFMGYLRATNKSAYDAMLNRLITEDKNFVDYYKSLLKTRISEDVMEEAFVEYVAKALSGNLLFESALDKTTELKNVFEKLFFNGEELNNSDLVTIGKSSLLDITALFGTFFRNGILKSTNTYLNSNSGTYRKYRNIISKLIRENKLIENC